MKEKKEWEKKNKKKKNIVFLLTVMILELPMSWNIVSVDSNDLYIRLQTFFPIVEHVSSV